MTFALLYLIHRWCPTSLHYTLHAHILRLPDHSQFLVVAPPSLPCSPPPSCLAPFLLSQASPCHRDTPRSHDDGGMHSRGRLHFFYLTSLGGCRVRSHTWTQVSADSLSFKLLDEWFRNFDRLFLIPLFPRPTGKKVSHPLCRFCVRLTIVFL